MPFKMSEFFKVLKAHNPLGLAQASLYFLSVFWGFLVAIPMGITLRNFDGQCVLFADVAWEDTVIYPYTKGGCDYVLYMNIAVSLMYALFMGIFTLMAVLPKTKKDPDRFGHLQWYHSRYVLRSLNPFFTIVNCVVVFMMAMSAIVVTAGLTRFCIQLQKALHNWGSPAESCYAAQDVDWNTFRIVGGRHMGVNGYNFHICLTIALIAAWALAIIWTIQLVLNFSQICRRCSCQIAEEKLRPDKSVIIAQRRSRLATPIGTPGHMTPGGRHTPVQFGSAHAVMGPNPQVTLQPLPPKA